jgi:hypothetical protein
VEAVREFRSELRAIEDFQGLIDSGVYDRFRRLKQRLGRAFLHPPVLTEIVVTNIEAKNQFDRLYRQEEVRILEETNRMFEIERFLERNPEATHDALRSQIEQWQRSRLRFEAGRRDDNVKRDDVLALRRAMDEVIAAYQRVRRAPGTATAGAASTVDQDATLHLGPPAPALEVDPFPQVGPDPSPGFADEAESASLTDLLPPDPLLNEPLHKIMFAIEMVAWDRSPDRVVHAPELHNLHLEPWEVAAYRHIVQRTVQEGTTRWELLVFFLRSAALRVKMEEEREEIARLGTADSDERAFELLERSAQSLERAREMDRRFQWFIDDTLYSGDTDQLEQLYRSRFRFLNAYSSLWLEHQAHGGLTPL